MTQQQFPTRVAQMSTTCDQHPWLYAILILGHIRQKGTLVCALSFNLIEEKEHKGTPTNLQVEGASATYTQKLLANASHVIVHM